LLSLVPPADGRAREPLAALCTELNAQKLHQLKARGRLHFEPAVNQTAPSAREVFTEF